MCRADINTCKAEAADVEKELKRTKVCVCVRACVMSWMCVIFGTGARV